MCIRPYVRRSQIPGEPDKVFKCGQCYECIVSRSQDWSTRMYFESLKHKYCYFITLTYNDQNLPHDVDLSKFGLSANLRYSDFQEFMNRLRYYIPSLRFFAGGEYGDLGMRPHYHLVLYIPDDCKLRLSQIPPIIQKCWSKGFTQVKLMEDLTNFRYLTDYLGKQLWKDMPSRYKPFNQMSRRPGLGQLDEKAFLKFLDYDQFGIPHFRIGKRLRTIPKYYLLQFGMSPDLYYEEIKEHSVDNLREDVYQHRMAMSENAERIYYKRLRSHGLQ